jgi:hypothetical protein
VPGNAVSSVGFLWVPPAADTELWGFCGGANTQVGEMVLGQETARFEPFRRLEGRDLADGGVGLGLSIARSVSTAHGAELDVGSQPEGGLSISIVLPPAGTGALAGPPS